MRNLPHMFWLSSAVAALLASGCSAGSMSTPPGNALAPLQSMQAFNAGPPPTFKRPALITFDYVTDALESWPITRSGGDQPHDISGPLGIGNVYGLAANKDVVAIANYSPAEIVTYNVRTKAEKTLTDPYGGPVDIAIDKQGALYALNLSNVAVFKPGSSNPSELTCQYINDGIAIAVNNEGDVFVNGYGPSGLGVIEYPAGSQPCIKPHLRAERGYAAGVGVDPRTDDLIVVDDPDFCAGGIEGRMIIYPKPYQQRTSRRRILEATYCSGTFRLDATSKLIFYEDATVSDGFPLIEESTYPGGHFLGTYQSSPSGYSGYFSGITTIPNRLPN
jgi:hypothetical protein